MLYAIEGRRGISFGSGAFDSHFFRFSHIQNEIMGRCPWRDVVKLIAVFLFVFVFKFVTNVTRPAGG